MQRTRFPITLALAAAALALPLSAAAGETSVACSVAVDYVLNGNPVQLYRKDFVVTESAAFFDDFSTPARFRTFSASVTRQNGDAVVAIDYFNDVGVFVSIGFDTALTLRGGGNLGSTSGSHATYVSTGVSPGAVGGSHVTNHLLSCRRL